MHYSSSSNTRGAGIVLRAVGLGAALWLAAAGAALAAGTLERVKETGKLTIGYLADAQPFSYTEASGKAEGYAIALCRKVADAVKAEAAAAPVAVEFVAISGDERFRALEQSKIDLLCGAASSLARRATLDFSIPIIASGTGAVVRADAPVRLVQVLSGREPAEQPIWRASPGQAPERRVLAVPGGTTVERALIDRLKQRRIVVEVMAVKDIQDGLQAVRDGSAAAFFADRALLLSAAKRGTGGDLVVLDRIFRREPVALALRRGDDDFRLLVDRTLSRLFLSKDIGPLYATYFGAPDQGALNFFELSALPD
jgi:ABC-type amino acid transport substrate-binding protein